MLVDIDNYNCEVLPRFGLKLVMYSAVRIGSLLEVQWPDFDLNIARCEIALSRVKMGTIVCSAVSASC